MLTRAVLTCVLATAWSFAAKKKGGFGAATAPKKVAGITADKKSLETQWDRFVSITELEIMPQGDDAFSVVDVFVRNKKADGEAPWWRIGKACAAEGVDVAASLALQRGLIFWTAVHMRPELMAAGGRAAAASLELASTAPSLYMAVAEDGPHETDDDDDDDDEYESDDDAGLPRLARKCPTASSTPPTSVGFRPDFNPEGFRYKRRETAALKKPSSRLEAEGLL